MKKFGKFLLGAASLAAVIGGVYSLYKKSLDKETAFDDFDDEDDDFDSDIAADSENREYVSINISGNDKTEDESEYASEEASDDTEQEPFTAEDAPAEETTEE